MRGPNLASPRDEKLRVGPQDVSPQNECSAKTADPVRKMANHYSLIPIHESL